MIQPLLTYEEMKLLSSAMLFLLRSLPSFPLGIDHPILDLKKTLDIYVLCGVVRHKSEKDQKVTSH